MFSKFSNIEGSSYKTAFWADTNFRHKYFYDCRPYWNCPNQEDNACNEPNECFCLERSSKNNQICSKYVKKEKNSPSKIQNKLPKGEEKPGNRDQMDRSTRPIGPG
jgi:hypothetical protein